MLKSRLALVAQDPGTLDAVHEYLGRFGARVSKFHGLGDPMLISTADGIVLFADDYPEADVVRAIGAMRTRVVIVVTSRGPTFELLRARTNRPRVVVLQRPAWGWMILDALRALATDDHDRS